MSHAFGRLSCRLGPSSSWRLSLGAPGLRHCAIYSARVISTTRPLQEDYDEKAKKLSQKGIDDEERELKARQSQIKRPWLRQDADKPPVEKAGEKTEPMTKGKLLTTPSRLLKLILPLPISVEKDQGNNSKSNDYARAISSNDEIQPLALLVHPQQPLSYVERLIQAELPAVTEDGKEKTPNIYFRAEDTGDSDQPSKAEREKSKTSGSSADARSHVASYSGLGHEGPERDQSDKNWVRWSSSTELGDFIRDAARGREFAIEVEGYNIEMRVSVPSFNDRTYYMRVRLRKMGRQIDQLGQIKNECDMLAHRGAHRIAKGGFGLLVGWWGVVYYATFWTEQGWDLVEPITYLAGLTTIMGGYLWFLYMSRDLSYKAAMNLTVSRRQSALYEERGFDMRMWEHLVQEANALRREIHIIATEYDVEWDDAKEVGEEVKETLDEEKNKRGNRSSDEEKEDQQLPEEKKEEKSKSKSKG